jgi:hypothetical protein
LIAANPDLAAEIDVYANQLCLRDGTASLKILPAKDTIGAHGKSAAFIGYDEIHPHLFIASGGPARRLAVGMPAARSEDGKSRVGIK